MGSKPRETKIWIVLQMSYLALATLVIISITLSPGRTTPSEPPDAYFASGGASMIALLLYPVLILWIILALALPFGLWGGKGWARKWGVIHSILSLLLGLLWIYVNVSIRLYGLPTTLAEDTLLIVGIAYVSASLSNLYLATRPRVQDFFKHSSRQT